MKNFVITFLTVCALSLVTASPAVAAAGTNDPTPTPVCQPIYGGGQNCVTSGALQIQKRVQVPKTNDFADSLNDKDAKFGPENTVSFQIIVKNTGGARINNITVKDVFPEFTSYASGPGTFDANNKTLTFTIDGLNAGESRTTIVTGRTAKASDLSSDTVCVTNTAIVSADSMPTKQNAAQFCIQRAAQPGPTATPTATPVPGQPTATPVPGQPAVTKGGKVVHPQPNVVQTPATGAETLALLGLIPAGALGVFLKKRSK